MPVGHQPLEAYRSIRATRQRGEFKLIEVTRRIGAVAGHFRELDV